MEGYNGYSPKERQFAFDLQKGALLTGRLVLKPHCEMCKQKHFMTAHLEDYNRPMEPYSLCVECHMNLHLRFEHPAGWVNFLYALRDGYKPGNSITVKDYFESKAARKIFDTHGQTPTRVLTDLDKWFERLELVSIDYRKQQSLLLVSQ